MVVDHRIINLIFDHLRRSLNLNNHLSYNNLIIYDDHQVNFWTFRPETLGPFDFLIIFATLLTVDGFVLIATTEKNAKTVSPRCISTIRPCLCLTNKIVI